MWEREIFYLKTHSTHFIYGYMASDIWLRTIMIVRKETRCRHIGYSYRLTARVLLYAPSHRQDNTYHGLCYTSRGALAGTRNSSKGPPHEGRSDDPLHHERTLYLWATSRSLMVCSWKYHWMDSVSTRGLPDFTIDSPVYILGFLSENQQSCNSCTNEAINIFWRHITINKMCWVCL